MTLPGPLPGSRCRSYAWLLRLLRLLCLLRRKRDILRVHLLSELLLGRGLNLCWRAVVEGLRLRHLLADATTEVWW